jgi:hypothetical protein
LWWIEVNLLSRPWGGKVSVEAVLPGVEWIRYGGVFGVGRGRVRVMAQVTRRRWAPCRTVKAQLQSALLA